MTILSPQTEARLRRGFKYFNRGMMLIWRLGLGSYFNGTDFGGSIMVLVHQGRKTGLKRRTPVNYIVVDGDIYCTAGFGPTSDWYRNLLAHPQVEVWLSDGWWAGVAEDVSAIPERVQIMRGVIVASGFAGRMFGFDPVRMDDDSLEQATRSYRLVRIHRTSPCTGPGGPGDLAWVWPVATILLLISRFQKRRSK